MTEWFRASMEESKLCSELLGRQNVGSNPGRDCGPSARNFTVIASHHPGVKWLCLIGHRAAAYSPRELRKKNQE